MAGPTFFAANIRTSFTTMYYKLNTFCGCISLQNGSILIGLFSLMCGLLGFRMAFIDTPYLNPVDAIITPFKNEITTSPYINVWTIVSTVTIVVTIPLLLAAWKDRGSLLPWLYVHPFLVFTGVGIQLYDGIWSLIRGDEHPIDTASSIAASLFASGIEFYTCLVVYSYRKELEEKAREKEKKRSETDVEITEPEPLLSYVNEALENGSLTSTRCFSDFRDPENLKDKPEECEEAAVYFNSMNKEKKIMEIRKLNDSVNVSQDI